MTRVTEIEYETTEKEVQKYKCDNCKSVVGEDGINTAVLFPRDAERKQNWNYGEIVENESKHLCEECIGLRRALRVREKEEYLKARWEGLREKGVSGINILLPIFTAAFTGLTLIIGGIIEPGDGLSPGYILAETVTGAIAGVICLAVATFIILLFSGAR